MKTTICLKNLTLLAIIGTEPQEREEKQTIVIDLFLEIQAKNFERDLLEESIDYRKIIELCQDVVSCQYQLLETLAYQLAKSLLEYKEAVYVKVSISKPCIFEHVIPCVTIELP